MTVRCRAFKPRLLWRAYVLADCAISFQDRLCYFPFNP